MKGKRSAFHLKSYNFWGQVTTVLLSVLMLIILIPLLFNWGETLWSVENRETYKLFGFAVVSLFGSIIPFVLIFSVSKTLIFSHYFVIKDYEIHIERRNSLTKNKEIVSSVPKEKIKELVAIRIRQDEDGIANQYHIFSVLNDGSAQKIFTFTKYHFALRLFYFLQENTSLSFEDLTEKNFERESDFYDFCQSDMT